MPEWVSHRFTITTPARATTFSLRCSNGAPTIPVSKTNVVSSATAIHFARTSVSALAIAAKRRSKPTTIAGKPSKTELHRLRAEILLDMDGNAVEEAEALFGQSPEIARRQESKTFCHYHSA